MKEKLKAAMKDAMKAKDAVRLATIRSVLSEIQYEEMQKGIDNADDVAIGAILQRELKKRKEEVEFAEKANRPELLEKLGLEMAVLESFLPKQLSSDELRAFFADLKQNDVGANRGSAMKQLKDALSGQYDGKVASAIAQEVFG